MYTFAMLETIMKRKGANLSETRNQSQQPVRHYNYLHELKSRPTNDVRLSSILIFNSDRFPNEINIFGFFRTSVKKRMPSLRPTWPRKWKSIDGSRVLRRQTPIRQAARLLVARPLVVRLDSLPPVVEIVMVPFRTVYQPVNSSLAQQFFVSFSLADCLKTYSETRKIHSVTCRNFIAIPKTHCSKIVSAECIDCN
jgi:hypothetical protein